MTEIDGEVRDDRGRLVQVRCRCPKCRHPITRVLRSGVEVGGEIVRVRTCVDCGHRWYTGQEPEYLLPAERVSWRRDRPGLKEYDNDL